MNTRPVRLPPCAAGARPSTRTVALAGRRSPAPADPSTPRRGTRPASRGRPAHATRPGAGRRGRPRPRPRTSMRASPRTATVGWRSPWRARRPPPPTSTLVLSSATARPRRRASCCPAGPPGLHLADAGRAQAERRRRADRRAEAGRRGLHLAARARQGDRRSDRRCLRLKVRVERGLLECDFGEWTGAELKALMKLPEWRPSSGTRAASGSRAARASPRCRTRIVDAIDRLRAARHPGGVVVAVSHADPIKAAVAHAMGTHLDLFQRIVISTCSITADRLRGRRARSS